MATPTPGAGIPASGNPFLGEAVARVDFTVGTETLDAIIVTASLRGNAKPAAAPANRQYVRAYLTQNLTTRAVAGAAPSGAVAIATKGAIVVTHTAKLVHEIACDANGEFDLTITEAGTATWYLVVEAGGRTWVSPAITFAA